MSNLKKWTIKYRNIAGELIEVEVLPNNTTSSVNWSVQWKTGYLHFGTKKYVRNFFKRKFDEVKG